jgi:hypothetical protein
MPGKKGARKFKAASEKIAAQKGTKTMRRNRNKGGRPKKTWAVDPILKATGAHGVDSRSMMRSPAKVGESSLLVPGVDPTVNVPVRITQRSLAYLSMGIVLRAIKHGLLGSFELDSNNHPYYAFRYLIDTFKNAVNSSVPTIQSAPLWFWEIVTALLPKTANCKTGRVAYQGFNLDDGEGIEPAFELGGTDEYYVVFWGSTNGGEDVNGFPVLVPPSAPYDFETNGADSAQSMFQYYEQQGMGKRIPKPDNNDLVMTTDTSAFAAVFAESGNSWFNPCGAASTAQSERAITAPIFAKFGQYQDGDIWRGFFCYRKTGGSPCYLGPRMSEFEHPLQIKNKLTPIIKFFNFDKFFLAVSYALCYAQATIRVQGGTSKYVQCPLTSQEAQIVLRQALIPYFCNDMAQDLRRSGEGWNVFLPLVVGPNGSSQGVVGAGPMYPVVIAENIKACKRITIKIPNRVNDGFQELDIIPVLGRPFDTPQLGNFDYAPGALLYSESEEEIPINLIDCSVEDGGTSKYLSLSGKTLQDLITAWNGWLVNVEGALVECVTLGGERGIPALSTLLLTQREIEDANPPPDPPEQQPANAKGLRPHNGVPVHPKRRIEKRGSVKRAHKGSSTARLKTSAVGAPAPVGPSTFYQDVAITGTTAQLSFASPLWKYHSIFVLPECLGIGTNEDTLQAYQMNVIEPFHLPATNIAGNFPTADQKCMQLGAACAKSYLSPNKTEMELELEKMTQGGKGGWFTSIAGAIGEGLGIKGSAQFAKSIGDITGL